jgi:hypothetical protein
MARVYTAKIKAQCWKAHTCHACGGVYAYKLTRKVAGKAGDALAATRTAKRAAATAISREVDVHPCPTCGTVQPDMIGQELARQAGWTCVGIVVLFGALSVATGAHVFPAHRVSWMFVVFYAAAALYFLWTQVRHPNADLAKNLVVARARVSKGRIRAHTPGRSAHRAAALARPGSWVAQAICCLLLAAPVLAASPEIIRSLHGWPLNEDWYPAIVGPGDRPIVRMRHSISSIKGYWRGRPEATMLIDGGGPAQNVGASTAGGAWGSTISAQSTETSGSATPKVTVDIPLDVSLAGQRGTVDIDLDVEYPVASLASKTFRVVTTHMHDSFSIQLASELEAGVKYSTAWWKGTLVASALILLGALGLFVAGGRMQRRANPTRVYR